MVTTLNITLDDSVADDARRAKDTLGLTWPEFIARAADALGERVEDPTAAHEPATIEHAPARRDEPAPDDTPEPPPDVGDVDLDVPGSGTTGDVRRAAIMDMYAYLREHGTATKSDLVSVVDADRVGYASVESFWSNAVKGRDTLRILPGVEAPGEGEHTWRYTE